MPKYVVHSHLLEDAKQSQAWHEARRRGAATFATETTGIPYEVAHWIVMHCVAKPAPPAEPRRYFEVEEMSSLKHITGAAHWVVARDLRHALETLSQGDFGDAVKMEIREMTAGRAAECRTHDDGHDRAAGVPERDRLSKWPNGTFLSENY